MGFVYTMRAAAERGVMMLSNPNMAHSFSESSSPAGINASDAAAPIFGFGAAPSSAPPPPPHHGMSSSKAAPKSSLNALSPTLDNDVAESVAAAAAKNKEAFASVKLMYISAGIPSSAVPKPVPQTSIVAHVAVSSAAAAVDDPALNMDSVFFAAILLAARRAGAIDTLMPLLTGSAQAAGVHTDDACGTVEQSMQLAALLRSCVTLTRGACQIPPALVGLSSSITDLRMRSFIEWATDGSSKTNPHTGQREATGGVVRWSLSRVRRGQACGGCLLACKLCITSPPLPSLVLCAGARAAGRGSSAAPAGAGAGGGRRDASSRGRGSSHALRARWLARRAAHAASHSGPAKAAVGAGSAVAHASTPLP